MAQINQAYARAAEKLGYPGSAACMNYLKVLFTPEEGNLLMEFLKPATCHEVAQRLNTNENAVQEKLDDFTRRRLLFHGKTEYCFQFGIHVFFARIPHLKDEYIPKSFIIAAGLGIPVSTSAKPSTGIPMNILS